MAKIIFIGKINQTNDIVSEILQSSLNATVDFIVPSQFFLNKESVTRDNAEIIIYDLNTSHGYGNAPDNIKGIKKSSPDIPVLVLNNHADKRFIQPLIEAGASGIISHTPTEAELFEAVSQLMNGNTFTDCPD